MSGTIEGCRKAAKTTIERHGADFYANIGAKGGRNGHTGGFALDKLCNCDLIDGEHNYRYCAGKKGGLRGKRGPTKR